MFWAMAFFAVYNVVAISDYGQNRVEREVHQELLRLPYYTVFDNLAYRVGEKGRVVLEGAVTNPNLKDDAEIAVKAIEGISHVENHIRVLPSSDSDQQLRMDLLRAIYTTPELQLYGDAAVPAIHLVVEEGKITLAGIVSGPADRELAEHVAARVPGVKSVTNLLAVQP